jgi:hypothetical protein
MGMAVDVLIGEIEIVAAVIPGWFIRHEDYGIRFGYEWYLAVGLFATGATACPPKNHKRHFAALS